MPSSNAASDALARHGVYRAPPWVRVTAVDPVSLAPVEQGEVGIARIVDLANVDSAVAIQTADRVRVLPEGIALAAAAALAADQRPPLDGPVDRRASFADPEGQLPPRGVVS